jgi:hypothetical protein
MPTGLVPQAFHGAASLSVTGIVQARTEVVPYSDFPRPDVGLARPFDKRREPPAVRHVVNHQFRPELGRIEEGDVPIAPR